MIVFKAERCGCCVCVCVGGGDACELVATAARGSMATARKHMCVHPIGVWECECAGGGSVCVRAGDFVCAGGGSRRGRWECVRAVGFCV